MQDEEIVRKIEQKKYIDALKRKYPEQKELIHLVEDDLERGLSSSEIDRYVNTKLNLEQMKVYSYCLQNKYTEEVIHAILNPKWSARKMETALDFFDLGIPIGTVQKIGMEYEEEKEMEKQLRMFLKKQLLGKEQIAEPLLELKEMLEKVFMQLNQEKEQYYRLAEEYLKIHKDEREEKEILLQNLSNKDNVIRIQKERIEKTVAELEQFKEELVKKKKSEKRRIFYKRKSGKKIVRMIAEKKLSAEQIMQIRMAMQEGVSEKVILDLIEHNTGAEQIQEIIKLTGNRKLNI